MFVECPVSGGDVLCQGCLPIRDARILYDLKAKIQEYGFLTPEYAGQSSEDTFFVPAADPSFIYNHQLNLLFNMADINSAIADAFNL